MTTEVEVRNFQSIEHAQIVIEGYTAVVGRSNIGKSAVVRAVKAALTGAAGTDFVRHGPNCVRRLRGAKKCHCKASVRIKRAGFDLLWEKGDNDSSYTFNGAVYDSIERGTPFFLMEGFAPIKIGDGKVLLQVAGQFDPIFLLDCTGGVVADVLSDVAHLDRINVAVRMVERDRRDAVSTRKVREQDVTVLSERLEGYAGLDAAIGASRSIETRLEEVAQADTRLRQLDKFLEHVNSRASEVKRLSGVDTVVLPDPALIQSTTDSFHRLAVWLERLVSFKSWYERFGMKGDTIEQVKALPVPDVSPLRDRVAAYGSVLSVVSRYNNLTAEIDRLESACGQASSAVEDVKAEWDALGMCPTCSQPCTGRHLEMV